MPEVPLVRIEWLNDVEGNDVSRSHIDAELHENRAAIVLTLETPEDQMVIDLVRRFVLSPPAARSVAPLLERAVQRYLGVDPG